MQFPAPSIKCQTRASRCGLAFKIALVVLLAGKAHAQQASSGDGALFIKVRAERVAFERPWLKRGHWLKTIAGSHFSEITDPKFFLSPRGPRDPEAELLATLLAFRQSDSMQCRYPSRARWLFARLRLEEFHFERSACPKIAEWKHKLNAAGLSVVFASSYLGNAASVFGHTFLKFHKPAEDPNSELLDYGVSFSANTGQQDGALFALNGIFGMYPGQFSLLPYHQTLKTYSDLEGRDIYEYHLNLTPQEIEDIIDHLLELEQTYFDYYFFDKNCSYQLLSLLEVGRPELDLSQIPAGYVIPADTVRLLVRVPELVTRITFRPSLESELNRILRELRSPETAELRQLFREKGSTPEPRKQLERPREQLVLDAAILQAELQHFADPSQANHIPRAWLWRRAQLGSQAYVLTPQPAPPGPDQGHEPGEVLFSGGQKSNDSYVALTLTPALHPLLARPKAYATGSELVALQFTGSERLQTHELRLQEVNLLNVRSITPLSPLGSAISIPWSWHAEAKLEHRADAPWTSALTSRVSYAQGFAIGFPDLGPSTATAQLPLFSALLGMNAEAAPGLRWGYRAGPSIEIALHWAVSEHFVFRLETTGFDYVLGDARRFFSSEILLGMSLLKNWELRAGSVSSAGEHEYFTGAAAHFML